MCTSRNLQGHDVSFEIRERCFNTIKPSYLIRWLRKLDKKAYTNIFRKKITDRNLAYLIGFILFLQKIGFKHPIKQKKLKRLL